MFGEGRSLLLPRSDLYRNKASFMKLGQDGYTLGQLTWVSHPFYLPNFMNGFQWAMP